MPIITFPGGQEVNVEFDPVAHSYVVAHKLANGEFSDFRPTHGITAPLVVVPKPFIKKWVAKLCTVETLKFVANHPEIVDRLGDFLQDLDDYENETLNDKGKKKVTYYRMNKNWPWFKDLKTAPDRASKEGQEFGTWLHESVENYYRSNRKDLPIITPDCQGMWDSFLMFDDFFKPEAEELEFFVYSLMFGYSGQGDFRGMINGKYCILDWKTTNRSGFSEDGISTDYFYQLGGLAQAEFERTGKWVQDIGAVNFDKKGAEPRAIFASEFGMSPQDAARAYISNFNNYHTQQEWDYKFKTR